MTDPLSAAMRSHVREDYGTTLPGVPAKTMLDEICGHLGAARMQLLPTDDQIIAEHLIAAHDLAKILRRAA